jgi:hypothetical protein
MKSQTVFRRVAWLALLLAALSTLNSQLSTVQAQGTAFTYQGVLQDGGAPATGLYDLEFRVFDAASGGAQVGLLTTANDLPVTNGLFTVTIDAGTSVFTGAARWLNIAVRPGASAGAYTNLAPRQSLTPTPYAIHAGGAASVPNGSITASNLASSIGVWSRSDTNIYYNAGLVGIGRVPANGISLDVAGFGRFSGILTFDDGTAGSRFSVRHDGPSQTLRFRDAWGGVDLMALNKSGNLGIGTTSPDRPLTLRSTLGQWISLMNDAGSNMWHIDSRNASGFHIAQTGGAGQFFISNNGNVGIGATAPSDKLHVAGGLFLNSDDARVRLQRTTGANYVDFNNGQPFFLRSITDYDSSANVRMTIDTAGHVGIGSTTNFGGLSVYGMSSEADPSVQGVHMGRINYGAGEDTQVAIRSAGGGAPQLRFFVPGQPGARMYLEPGSRQFRFDGMTSVHIAGEATMTAVNLTSDRNAKEDFKPVSARSVLEKVASLAITEWQYKEQPGVRHIGPVAQDFREAFGVGRDEKHITTVDADGVALAAIQGLNAKVDEKDARIQQLEQTVAELKELVTKLARQQNGGAK